MAHSESILLDLYYWLIGQMTRLHNILNIENNLTQPYKEMVKRLLES